MTAVPYRYASTQVSAQHSVAGSVSSLFSAFAQLGQKFRGTAVQAIVSVTGPLSDGTDWAGATWALDTGSATPVAGPFFLHYGTHSFPVHINFTGSTLGTLRFRISPGGANWVLGTFDDGSGLAVSTRVSATCSLLILPLQTF